MGEPRRPAGSAGLAIVRGRGYQRGHSLAADCSTRAPQAGQLCGPGEGDRTGRRCAAAAAGHPPDRALSYSHSIVAGGLELTSYTTRFTPSTSLAMRLDIRPSTSGGKANQSAVIPSRLVTALRAMT